MRLDPWELEARQKLSLDVKVSISIDRIIAWYKHFEGAVYVSFSGGKDSTVLLHLTRLIYSDIPGVFVDTGLEYPEIRSFVKETPNIIWLKPKMTFPKVLEKYGFPLISKDQACAIDRYRRTEFEHVRQYRLHGFPNGKRGMISKKWQYILNYDIQISDRCCDIMKKNPLDQYAKKTKSYPLIGTMATESNKRQTMYIERGGCNAFQLKKPISWPLGFWTDSDIWEYIREFQLPYSPIYDRGYVRTGCMFCAFGVHHEKEPNRFQLMKLTHPKLWEYCIFKLGLKEPLDLIKVPYE